MQSSVVPDSPCSGTPERPGARREPCGPESLRGPRETPIQTAVALRFTPSAQEEASENSVGKSRTSVKMGWQGS